MNRITKKILAGIGLYVVLTLLIGAMLILEHNGYPKGYTASEFWTCLPFVSLIIITVFGLIVFVLIRLSITAMLKIWPHR